MTVCYIGNIAAFYRAEIFSKMCQELSCEFYFGQPFDNISRVKTLPLSFFTTHAEMLHNIPVPVFKGYWQKKAVGLIQKHYNIYIVTGEIACYSTWVIMIMNRLFYHKKIVLWGHGWYGREKFLKTQIKKVYYALSDRIMVYGDRAKELMMKEGINPEKIFVVHNSLSYSMQNEIIKKMTSNNPIQEHFKNNYPTIVFSGRLVHSKRIDMIIEVLSLLKEEKIAANCVLIGDGPEMQALKLLVQEKDLNNLFWFYGSCYDESIIGSFFRNATVCVSPGNVGLTAIHSMTFGCPVITHNNFAYQGPEYEAITPGETGDFFEYNNIDSLKSIVKKWIMMSQEQRENTQKMCSKTIRDAWNPDYQIKIITSAINF